MEQVDGVAVGYRKKNANPTVSLHVRIVYRFNFDFVKQFDMAFSYRCISPLNPQIFIFETPFVFFFAFLSKQVGAIKAQLRNNQSLQIRYRLWADPLTRGYLKTKSTLTVL